MVAVVVCTLAAFVFHLPVETIAARFGAVPSTLPLPALPQYTWAMVIQLAPDAVAIALLGGIESLLSAVVADGMSNERHNANMELVARALPIWRWPCSAASRLQAPLPARRRTSKPCSWPGLWHVACGLCFAVHARGSPLLGYIPLAALAGILAMVAYNMIEWDELGPRLLASRTNTLVVFLTFALTVFEDLLTGIGVGMAVWWRCTGGR